MKPLTLTALALALSASAAWAQQTNESQQNPMPEPATSKPMTGDSSFDQLDANHDGFLEKSELMGDPALAQNFAKIDTDGDGKVSPAEWKSWGPHRNGGSEH